MSLTKEDFLPSDSVAVSLSIVDHGPTREK